MPCLLSGTCFTGREDYWNSQLQNFVVSSRLTLVALWVRSLTHMDRTKAKAQHIYLSLISSEKQENYFLLCDVLPEDRVLRERLQQRRLVRNIMLIMIEIKIPKQKKKQVCVLYPSIPGGGARTAAGRAGGQQLPARLHVLQ